MWNREEALAAAERALGPWDDFPTAVDPRPVVLTGPRLVVTGGFDSGAAKHAFLTGRFEMGAGVAVPDDVLGVLRTVRRDIREGGDAALLTAAVRTEAEFETDRGRRSLAAWRLEVAGLSGAVVILEPEVEAQLWSPSADGSDGSDGSDAGAYGGQSSSTVDVAADGRTATLHFDGSPAQYTDYPEVLVVESAAAVAFVPVPVEKVPLQVFHVLLMGRHSVQAVLTRPLGNRVVVDPWTGGAVAVTHL